MTNEIHTCPELMDYIQQVGFLPLCWIVVYKAIRQKTW